jgi:hypothetical protein
MPLESHSTTLGSQIALHDALYDATSQFKDHELSQYLCHYKVRLLVRGYAVYSSGSMDQVLYDFS